MELYFLNILRSKMALYGGRVSKRVNYGGVPIRSVHWHQGLDSGVLIDMEMIPYFLALIKKNLLLSAIITTGNFSQLDLKSIEHDKWSDRVIEFKNFSLSNDDNFSEVKILIDSTISITFFGNDAKYFERPDFYFGRDSVIREKDPISFGGIESVTKKKSLGEFEFNNKSVFITLRKTTISGYSVSLLFKRD